MKNFTLSFLVGFGLLASSGHSFAQPPAKADTPCKVLGISNAATLLCRPANQKEAVVVILKGVHVPEAAVDYAHINEEKHYKMAYREGALTSKTQGETIYFSSANPEKGAFLNRYTSFVLLHEPNGDITDISSYMVRNGHVASSGNMYQAEENYAKKNRMGIWGED